jgi:hypothetical protein
MKKEVNLLYQLFMFDLIITSIINNNIYLIILLFITLFYYINTK